MEGLAIFIIVLLLFFVWLCLTEFSYLPKCIHRTIYDVFASGYEKKWSSSSYQTHKANNILLESIREKVGNRPDAVVLDLACGTGRISKMIMVQPWFCGQIHAIDQSVKMLEYLQQTITTWDSVRQSRISIEIGSIEKNEFPSSDVVALMEAGEFIPSLQTVIHSIRNSLRPDGILMMTRPPSFLGIFFFGRNQTRGKLHSMLLSNGFVEVEEFAWRWRYRIVIARFSLLQPPGLTRQF